MKQILFINQSLGIGGAETFNKGLFVWLQKHDIKVKAFVTNKTFQKDLNSNGIETKHIPIIVDVIGDWKGLLKGIFLFIPGFIYYKILVFNNRDTDLILMSGYIEKIFVTPIAKLLKIPVIWIEFAPLEAVFSKFFGFPKFLYSLFQNLPNKIVVPSQYTKTCLQEEAGIDEGKIEFIPCARDVEKYSEDIVPNRVVCVSRLEKGKGQDLLIKAWPKVIKENKNAKLVIVGEGDFRTELTELVRNLNVEESVTFTGFVNDSLSEIAKGEFLVFPTIWPLEGFGMTAVEAMALSKPVICFNFGPLPGIVDSRTGILVKSGDIDALANAIIKLLKSPKSIKDLGLQGRKKYLNEFTFEKVGPKYLKVFENNDD